MVLEFVHDGVEDVGAGAEVGFFEGGEGVVDEVLLSDEVGAFGGGVEEAGDEFVFFVAVPEEFDGGGAVADVVLRMVEGSEGDDGAVVEEDAGGLAGLLLDGDFLVVGDEADFMKRFLVFLGPVPAFGGAGEVVEGDAGADDVEEGGASMVEGGLEEWEELFAVAGEGAGDKGRAGGYGFEAEV